ncbi:hypothetical protein E1B28_005241 [Marasmius oreades]|uniref:Uncharacterized protein n=1 Tax=Marasmius oreades TaxID=181124 RepID=A0A9P7V071_9AGAR|nr:uncharacterized protein E1B28_005241 [Marasmius oreades]KAG7097930.1 hypothetical protein E1B28_005241 [Marasmius oreades]
MSFFQKAYQVSIGQGTFSAITGNQTNNTYNHCTIIERQKKKRTIYDEFPDIQRGLVRRLEDLDHKDCLLRWNSRLEEYEVEFAVERTISTAKIHGDSSCFTVVSYKGQDAQKAWKKDFRQFSETTNTMKMQLFGINRSSVPLLIFYGELLPLAHLWDRLGDFGQGYACTLACRVWNCQESEVWLDPAQGTLIRGVEGPNRSGLFHLTIGTYAEMLPSSVELLDEDVCFRYFSRFPLVKEFDRDIIDVLHFLPLREHEISPIFNRPYVLSRKTDSIIAVGNSEWKADYHPRCLDDKVIMPDGRTRFTLTNKDPKLKLFLLGDLKPWLSQASSVFDRLGISLDDDLLSYKLILPRAILSGFIENSQPRSDDQPIYLFLPICLPSEGDFEFTHTWSYDENGQTPIPRHHCEVLGLPIKLSLYRFASEAYYWPSEMYKSIHKWQTARGFDPTTTDFTRYLEYPIYEVRPSESGQFEELCAAGSSEA